MYIISKYKDYYDGVAGSMGIDKTMVYERHINEINDPQQIPKEFIFSWDKKKNKFPPLTNYNLTKKTKYQSYSEFFIGFCGKIYIGYKFFWVNKDNTSEYDIIYELSDNQLISKNYHSKLIDNMNYIKNYDVSHIFLKYNCPIFLFDKNYQNRLKSYQSSAMFVVNPILKDYEFYKIFDSFSAFQEISMYIGNVLGTKEKETINIPEKYRILQHGFDKWSFRKEPQNK